MKLGQKEQEKLNLIIQEQLTEFLNENAIEYWNRKKLTPKKAELICEYTKFLINRISGKTV